MGLLAWLMVILGAFAAAYFGLLYLVPAVAMNVAGLVILGAFVAGIVLLVSFVRRRRGDRTRV